MPARQVRSRATPLVEAEAGLDLLDRARLDLLVLNARQGTHVFGHINHADGNVDDEAGNMHSTIYLHSVLAMSTLCAFVFMT